MDSFEELSFAYLPPPYLVLFLGRITFYDLYDPFIDPTFNLSEKIGSSGEINPFLVNPNPPKIVILATLYFNQGYTSLSKIPLGPCFK